MSEKKFTGRIGRTVADTEYSFETKSNLPKNAPNILYIVLDDLGFSGLGCYGSNIDTPNINRLAQRGLRYNNFHTTAICSATRASLLTGANHHEVGVASIIEMKTGCPNAKGRIDPAYGTLAEILKEYDYSTYAAGKWHLSAQDSPSGPYDDWPLGKGFDRYYGFLAAEIDHFHPQLTQDNSYVEQPKLAKEGYYLTEDITNHAIDYLYQHKNSFPDKPFFLYLAYGSAHAPHQAPKKYIDKYKGRFDAGWDVLRAEWFENQKKIGIIPKDAELTDRAPFVDAWDLLDDTHKKLYARYMEAFAGMVDYTDEQIGRVLDYLESIGQLDNTIVVLLSDNGASAEGGREGRFNRFTAINITDIDEEADAKFALEHFDEIGSEYSFNQYPSGWANALNTPFQWYKTWTHEGGVKDPLIISYPKTITDKGGIRSQYLHVSDITPTILDILGVEKPASIKGVAQKDFTGISAKYTFDQPEHESLRKVQYYEIFGNRAIYKDGWKAVANHALDSDYANDKWELFHVAEDYSEKHDVSEQYPEKLKELQEEFLIEAAKNNVFPLVLGSMHAFPEKSVGYFGKVPTPESERVYTDMFKPYTLTEDPGFRVDSVSHFIEVEIKREEEDEGVLFAAGDRFGGFVLYIKDNKFKYVYNANRVAYFKLESGELPLGRITVRADFTYHGKNDADVVIFVNGEEVGRCHISRTYFQRSFNSLFIRYNPYTEISPEYEVPFEFTGEIKKVVAHTLPSIVDRDEDLRKLQSAE